jgi:hypothetical protein
LVPDIPGELLTEGSAAYAGNDFATSAIAADGRLSVTYLPAGRPVTVNLQRLRGKTVRATWFNPRTGEKKRTDTFTNQVKATLPAPDAEDWVLLLVAAG